MLCVQKGETAAESAGVVAAGHERMGVCAGVESKLFLRGTESSERIKAYMVQKRGLGTIRGGSCSSSKKCPL